MSPDETGPEQPGSVIPVQPGMKPEEIAIQGVGEPSVEEQFGMIRVDIHRILRTLDELKTHEHSPHTGRPVVQPTL
jgi:50S ribosomal subunit-associated GTPase HflX